LDELGVRPDDYKIQKRKYSAFYGTDLEILLKGLKAMEYLQNGAITSQAEMIKRMDNIGDG
jgi:nicotinamidase-related amidase